VARQLSGRYQMCRTNQSNPASTRGSPRVDSDRLTVAARVALSGSKVRTISEPGAGWRDLPGCCPDLVACTSLH